MINDEIIDVISNNELENNESYNETEGESSVGNTKNEISKKVNEFFKENRYELKSVSRFRCFSLRQTEVIHVGHKKIYRYLSNVKIMIITANEIERDSLFAYFSFQSAHHIVKIAKNNIVYSFFTIRQNRVVHIEPASIGSYAHGGASSAISEAIKVVKPSIIISLGVAFGANYEKHEIGDVLVGRQHFSYDKASKISDGQLKIKKLHIEEPDDYMLSRFKSNVSTEEKHHGFYNTKFNVVLGNMVTGEFVVDSMDMRTMIFSPFQPFDIVGGEMEAFGIFKEIKKYHGIHCILIKGICDWGAGKNDESFIDYKDLGNGYMEEIPYNPKKRFSDIGYVKFMHSM